MGSVLEAMIVRTSQGYQVWSKHRGKPLSRPNLTKKEAQDRHAANEMFNAKRAKKAK